MNTLFLITACFLSLPLLTVVSTHPEANPAYRACYEGLQICYTKGFGDLAFSDKKISTVCSYKRVFLLCIMRARCPKDFDRLEQSIVDEFIRLLSRDGVDLCPYTKEDALNELRNGSSDKTIYFTTVTIFGLLSHTLRNLML